ncbi:MAG: YceI family protein [Planktomarina sp.]
MKWIFALIFWITATVATAQAVPFKLNLNKSNVDFIYSFNSSSIKGTIPLQSADVSLDLRNIANSKVSVQLSPSKAEGGFPFATPILRGAEMLDAANHPSMAFVSTAIRGTFPTGKMTGNLTMAGVTHPVTLDAQVFRQTGTDPSNLSQLVIELKGSLNRHDFDMSGYTGFVDDIVHLRIMAWIDRTG